MGNIVNLGKSPFNKLSHAVGLTILCYWNPILLQNLFPQVHQLSKDVFEFYLTNYYVHVYFFTSLDLLK